MFRVRLVCVGRMRAGPERELTVRYLERARATGRQAGLDFELREVDASAARQVEVRRGEEAASIRAAAGEGPLILLDELGRAITSGDFSAMLGGYRDSGEGGVSLVVGGADGLAASLKSGAAQLVAFGAMTWPHLLVRVMASEQLYRTATILTGHPYHRA